MGKNYCKHGCYPVDKRWHGGDFVIEEDDISDVLGMEPSELQEKVDKDVYSGGDLKINDIFKFRRIIDATGDPEAGENMMNEATPAGEPYVRGSVGPDDEPVTDKIKKREISISSVGQGPGLNAHLDLMDMLSTHYKYDPVSKVTDAIWASAGSQVHQELVQRRQQAEQQINRTLGNLADLYQQKQLLEHDLRQLEARLTHVKEGEEAESEGYEGYEDELKADFVDLVDQHTGRHSILQMQANNVFPSITADFYSMTGVDDLREGGHLENLPENEKAVLRKKWKLYEQWKQQFQSAVRSRYQDVKTRLNSVQTSIEQTEEWIKPYVLDIKTLTDDFEEVQEIMHVFRKYLPVGNANTSRAMKAIAAKDVTPGSEQEHYYDVLVTTELEATLPPGENPQQAGGGLAIFAINFHEYVVCTHVFEAVFQAQIDQKHAMVEEYVKKYIGEGGPLYDEDELEPRRNEIRDEFNIGEPGDDGDGNGKGAGKLKFSLPGRAREDYAERIADAQTMEELDKIENELEWKYRRPGWLDRQRSKVELVFGVTGDIYHPEPDELHRELVGDGFPRQLYLDYKYSNGLFVMK